MRKSPGQSSRVENSPGSWWNIGISRAHSVFVPFVSSEGEEGLLGSAQCRTLSCLSDGGPPGLSQGDLLAGTVAASAKRPTFDHKTD